MFLIVLIVTLLEINQSIRMCPTSVPFAKIVTLRKIHSLWKDLSLGIQKPFMAHPESQKMEGKRQAEGIGKESDGGSPYRKVYVCDEKRNSAALFCSNKIKTSKYTPLNFIFKNLWFQFHKVANVYFVFVEFLKLYRLRQTGSRRMPCLCCLYLG